MNADNNNADIVRLTKELERLKQEQARLEFELRVAQRRAASVGVYAYPYAVAPYATASS